MLRSTLRRIAILGLFLATLISASDCSAQYFRTGPFGVSPFVPRAFAPSPYGGVSIRSPFFSLDVAPSPRPFVAPVFGPVVRVPVVIPRPVVPQVYVQPAARVSVTTIRPIVVPPVVTSTTYSYAPRQVSYQYQTAPAAPVAQSSYHGSVEFGNDRGYVIPTPTSGYASQTSRVPTPASPVVSAKPADPQELNDQLIEAAQQLKASLERSNDDQSRVWLDYLTPDEVVAAASRNNGATLTQILRAYDGVAENKDLASVTNRPGFERSRALMRAIVGPEEEGTVVRSNEGSSEDEEDAEQTSGPSIKVDDDDQPEEKEPESKDGAGDEGDGDDEDDGGNSVLPAPKTAGGAGEV